MSDQNENNTGSGPATKTVIYGLAALSAVLFLADALYHKHPYFSAESWFGFYGVFGFVMCAGLVLVAKLLQVFLTRDEEYYDHDR